MSAHFDALMDIGRFQGGQFELNLARVPLGAITARVDGEFAHMCANKGLAWRLEIEDAMVSTDEQLLVRLLRNLLVNAVQYTAQGEVCCIARSSGAFIEFAVSDTGCGIAPEHQEAVFREFVRLNVNGVRSNGAGLGLSIVRRIDQALGLDLRMSSASGSGTRFSFRLPVSVQS